MRLVHRCAQLGSEVAAPGSGVNIPKLHVHGVPEGFLDAHVLVRDHVPGVSWRALAVRHMHALTMWSGALCSGTTLEKANEFHGNSDEAEEFRSGAAKEILAALKQVHAAR